MPLSTPWTWTVNAVDHVLNRILGPERKNNGAISTVYANADESRSLTVEHVPSPNRVQHKLRKVVTKVTVDDDTGLPISKPPSLTLYFTIDRPVYGFTVAEIQQEVAALKSEALTDAVVAQLHGKES